MEQKRLKAFHAYSSHPWLKKVYCRLKGPDIELAESFIATHSHLNKGDFELAVNRMFLDMPNKPKRFREILELLTCTNSSL